MSFAITNRVLTASSKLVQTSLTSSRRHRFSFSKLVSNFFKGGNQATTNTINMEATIQQLTQERQKLEERVHELVEKLEAKKKPGEIKLTKEQVIRPREEKDAAEAIEKLEIKDPSAPEHTANKEPENKPADAKKKAAPKQKGGAKAAPEPEKPLDISRLDLRIGKILQVERHPDADSLYVEKIDCGDPTGPRTVISGLVKHVPIEEMLNRNVVVLCNLKPVKMRGILSEAMVMCASTPEKVELLGTPENVKPGDRVTFGEYPGEPDAQLNPKKKVWELVSPDIKTNDDGVAMYKESPFKISGVDGQFKSSLKGVNIR